MFKKICEAFSPSGVENEIRALLEKILAPVFDECRTDKFGNFIARKKGNGERICVECGMDTSGIMAVSVEEEKVFFTGFGGIKAAALIGEKIRFENGAKGFVRRTSKSTDTAEFPDLYIELAEGAASIGDIGAVNTEYSESGKKLYMKGITAAVPILAAVSAALEIKESENDVEFVFSAQKMLGGRGTKAFFGVNEFDKIISVCACDDSDSFKAGGGCGIAVKDKKTVTSPRLAELAVNTAEMCGIKHTSFVAEENLMLENPRIAGSGAEICGICIPVEFSGDRFEAVYKSDIEAAARLICALTNMKTEERA